MTQLGGTAYCCCHCCKDQWCSHNDEGGRCSDDPASQSSLRRRASVNGTAEGDEEMNQITDGGQRENTVGVEITLTEEETDQLASSAEDSEMDQMINIPDEKKNDQLEEEETDEK